MAHNDEHILPEGTESNDLSLRRRSSKKNAKEVHIDSDVKEVSSGTEADTLTRFLQLPISDLLINTNAGIFLTDDQDKLIWVNDVMLGSESLGPEVRVILNRPVSEVLQYLQEFVVYPHLFTRRVKELLKDRKFFFGELIPLRNEINIGLDYIPVFHKGKFFGAIWQLTDCTHRSKEIIRVSHHADGSFPEMLDKFHVSYCEIDADGDIGYVSRYFCKYTGYHEDELLKTSFLDICFSGKQQVLDCLKRNRSGLSVQHTFSFELEIILRNGSHKWVQCQVLCKADEKSVSSLGMLLTEITEQKIIQQELEDARKIAEHAQLAQQRFLASMSHDIRTPLNAIIGMTFLTADTPLNNEQQEYLKILKNASNILLGLLNGVLDFAKIESGKQEIRQRGIDLPELLQSLVETFRFKLNNKPVKLYCEIDPGIEHVLLGDDVLLNQILVNLLGNAEKFTAEGKIVLKTTLLKTYEQNVWIEFRVEDTGIGISKEKLKTIFQEFIQADEDIRANYGGSGLGLFICKRLVEMMGGEISVESTQGKGTLFIFSLPFVLSDQLLKKEKKQVVSRHNFNREGVRILVVEDNPMNLKYLSTLLNKNQICFDVAVDDREALKRAEEQFYNLILMDMRLPRMTGMDVAAWIRKKPNMNSATPIVLVSAAAFQSTVDEAREVGVNELLTKPYTPEQLMDILQRYLVEEDAEGENSEELLKNDSFAFDERLDVAYLRKLYSDNCNYAISLFHIFLEYMESDWEEIQQAVKNKDWQQLTNLVHKVKPNFSMVGLTWITAMMQDVYKKLKADNHASAIPLLQEVQKEFDQYMPLIRDELGRMQQFVKQ